MHTIVVNLPVRKPELLRALLTELGLMVNPGVLRRQDRVHGHRRQCVRHAHEAGALTGFHRRRDRRRHSGRGPDEPAG